MTTMKLIGNQFKTMVFRKTAKMQRSITLILSVILTMNAYSECTHFYTSNLEAYEGTWKCETESYVFTMELRKTTFHTRWRHTETLVGDYGLIRNGNVVAAIENPIDHITDYNLSLVIIHADNAATNPALTTDSVLFLYFFDKEYQKESLQFNYLRLLENGHLLFHIQEDEGAYLDDYPLDIWSVPTDMELVRVGP